MKKKYALAVTVLLILGQACSQKTETEMDNNQQATGNEEVSDELDQYTFELSDKVTRQKVSFKNRYGITYGPYGLVSLSGFVKVCADCVAAKF